MNNYKISMAGSGSEYESFLRESIRDSCCCWKAEKASHRSKQIRPRQEGQRVCEQAYQPEFSPADVTEYVGISPSRLSVFFSETEHQTLRDYILEQRINTAKEILRFTD